MFDFKSVNFDQLENEVDQIDIVSSPDIAIIGMSIKFPQAPDVHTFWRNISEGKDAVTTVSHDRKEDLKQLIAYHPALRTMDLEFDRMNYLEDIDKFDYGFFNISPNEADLMDPHQRLFVETAWHAIEDAGYGGTKLSNSNTGVYVGYSPSNVTYSRFVSEMSPESGYLSFVGNVSSVIASRIAYLMNLKGPSIMVDTACSSSLAALHLACQGLRAGECEQAIVGGVALNLFPLHLEGEEGIGIESTDGQTRSFDDLAEGPGGGEGVGAIMLKPLHRAIRDKDNIHSVIKGSAWNQDGKSIGLSAPNPVAQAEVIMKAWENAGVRPDSISYIEAHGSATKLGDPIEIEGITKAFHNYITLKQHCGVGSVKSNIGHLGAAAGLAGLIKSVLAMKNKKLPPSLNFSKPNRNINFMNSSVYVNTNLTDWEVDGPRRCGVSSFGVSGTNVHVVLEEYQEQETSLSLSRQDVPFYLGISAKDEEDLSNIFQSYDTFLKRGQVDLANFCYTANTGRGQEILRVLFSFRNIKELCDQLNAVLSGSNVKQAVKGIYYPNHSEFDTELPPVTRDFLAGKSADWELFYAPQETRKISIPVYPFKRTRCWVKPKVNAPALSKYIKNAELPVDEIEPTDGDETLQQMIVCIWKNVLGYNTIREQDNFFDLGGDSILAMKITNQINKKLSLKIEPVTLLSHPIMVDYLQAIEEKTHVRGTEDHHTAILPTNDANCYPLSLMQQRMFILNQLDEKSISYNIPLVAHVKGNWDKARFQEAIQRLVDRHKILHTRFGIVEGEPVQLLHKFDIEINCFKAASKEIQPIINQFVRPFNIFEEPLFRVSLVEISSIHHIILIDLHHIIADGTSMGILIQEFIALYEGQTLLPPVLSYPDFAVWQKNEQLKERYNNNKSYWLKVFSETAPVLELTTDFPRTTPRKQNGERIVFSLDAKLSENLLHLATESKMTLFMILLSGLYIVLQKYTHQEDIVIGSAVSGRYHPDTENMVGMFVNTLPLRGKPSTDKLISHFLHEIQEVVLGALQNQSYPFDELVADLKLERDNSRNPLFDVMFTMQNLHVENKDMGDVTIIPEVLFNKTSKFDLNISATESRGTIQFVLEYCTDLFTPHTINQIISHLVNVYGEIVVKKDMRISDIQVMSEIEHQQILLGFNSESIKLKEYSIHQVFEQQAALIPDQVAVIYDQANVTYAQLNQRANNVARILKAKEINTGSVVAIMVERSLAMVISMLGSLKAGAAYLPLDPDWPAERIRFVLEDSGAEVLLIQEKFASSFTSDVDLIVLDEIVGEDGVLSPELDHSSVDSHEMAYILYTSGTTGTPKGVIVEHRNVVDYIYSFYSDIPEWSKDSLRFAQIAPYYFDGSIKSIFGAILGGHTLYIVPEEIRSDPDSLTSFVRNNQIQVMDMTPSLVNLFLESNLSEKLQVETLFIGGEPLYAGTIRQFMENLMEETVIYNVYGPTETTVNATKHRIVRNQILSDQVSGIVPVGKPLPNRKLYVVDENMKIVPVGVSGELLIGGSGVARGYLNNSQMTTEKFIDSPFQPGDRLYKSGDIVKWLSDGSIQYIGRSDDQVKVRGYRIELQEIQAHMRQMPFVKNSYVTVVKGLLGENDLCVYFVPSDGDVLASNIQNRLSQFLPGYMVPTHYIALDKIPLLRNGKVDKEALPGPTFFHNVDSKVIQPRDVLEHELASIWRKVLHVENISVYDNFFSMGGNSLKAILLKSSLSKKLNIDIVLSDIFKYTTIESLANHIRTVDNTEYVSIPKTEELLTYPLTSSQQRMLVLHQLNRDSLGYNMPAALE
ncbi:amino acid adenylation domain-containing protein, partial [Paenibacillus intestini]|nr:amino acid adenylation domain-containing protein [Paenibacillus intestini]